MHSETEFEVNQLETWLSLVEMLMDLDGFLVLGSFEPRQVGQSVPDRMGLGVFYQVQGDASAEDARRQMRLIEKFSGCVFEEPPSPPHFYKTVMVTN